MTLILIIQVLFDICIKNFQKLLKTSIKATCGETIKKELDIAIRDIVQQYKKREALTQKQKTLLFRALACFLSKHAAPPMMDKCVKELTVHAVTQAIVSLQEETGDETAVAAGVTIYVEPAEFSPIKLSHTVPRCLVDRTSCQKKLFMFSPGFSQMAQEK